VDVTVLVMVIVLFCITVWVVEAVGRLGGEGTP
jgi:hypothetical protein